MTLLVVSSGKLEVLRNEGRVSSVLPGSKEPGIFLPALGIIADMENDIPDLHPQGVGRGCPRKGEAMSVSC